MKKARLTEKERKAREEAEKYLALPKYTRKTLDADIARWTSSLRFLEEANAPESQPSSRGNEKHQTVQAEVNDGSLKPEEKCQQKSLF